LIYLSLILTITPHIIIAYEAIPVPLVWTSMVW
jgi:hypothetical protein